jgi:hypothetical protein
MNKLTFNRLLIATVFITFVTLSVMVTAVQATPGFDDSATFIVAERNGQERRGDRGDNRNERSDARVDCRQEKGAGHDKRDCKQDARSDRRGGDDDDE